MKKLVVCVSGFGSNLQAIIDACHCGKINAKIVLVASNRTGAYGLVRAVNSGIKTFCSNNVHTLFAAIEKEKPDLIALAGFMKIIPGEIVSKFKGKIINIHPSILPAFPGLNAIKKSFESKVSETGVSVHYVDEGVDTGEIIAQIRIPISPEEPLFSIEKRIHDVEHVLYPDVIQKLISN